METQSGCCASLVAALADILTSACCQVNPQVVVLFPGFTLILRPKFPDFTLILRLWSDYEGKAWELDYHPGWSEALWYTTDLMAIAWIPKKIITRSSHHQGFNVQI